MEGDTTSWAPEDPNNIWGSEISEEEEKDKSWADEAMIGEAWVEEINTVDKKTRENVKIKKSEAHEKYQEERGMTMTINFSENTNKMVSIKTPKNI